VIKGVEWAAQAHLGKVAKGNKKFKGSAANMSLGGGKSTALDMSVNAAVGAGLHFAVAAGNDNADACSYSPAAAESAVTVGASNIADQRAEFSNIGKCVDIFAPGVNVESTWIGTKYATNTISGTSMASPHIAGLLAYFISLQPKSDSSFSAGQRTPKQLKEYLVKIGSKGRLSGIPSGTINTLAFNGGGSANLSEILEETPDHESPRGRLTGDISDITREVAHETKEFLDDLEDKTLDEIRALFKKAKAAINEGE